MIRTMQSLPHDLYRADEVRELDRIAIEECGLGGGVLMERAGRAAYAVLQRCWPQAMRVVVLCGSGNNGGDGYVVARLALQAGLYVRLVQVGEISAVGDALIMRQQAEAVGVVVEAFAPELFEGVDVIVDALLGTGLRGEVRGVVRGVITAVNDVPAAVLAVDVPSGLDADSGSVLGSAIRADATITFIALKQGLLTAQGPDLCGDIYYDRLDVPAEIYRRVPCSARRMDMEKLRLCLPPRPRTAHKGDNGHVLVVGGTSGYAGAARLAGEAALRCGAGLVSVATRPEHATALVMARPEIMGHAVAEVHDLDPLLRRADVVVVGPGLGRDRWAWRLLAHVFEQEGPLVVDADALNLLAEEPFQYHNWVLTPHPGEAARLLGCSVGEVEQNRFVATASLQASYGGVIVLKGAGTLVLGREGFPEVCDGGNPGMASGGMGDLLGGVIGALIAQGMTLHDAARLGVALHAHAGDLAASDGARGMLASDLLPLLRRLVN